MQFTFEMSFSDASVQKQAVRSGGAAGVRRSEELSDSLQNFQVRFILCED